MTVRPSRPSALRRSQPAGSGKTPGSVPTAPLRKRSGPPEFLRSLLAVAFGTTFALGAPSAARAALTSPQRVVLTAYLDALAHGRYASAFALLSDDERRYFRSATNLQSVYDADRFKILSFRIVGSETTPKGTVALVSERVSFADRAHDAVGSAAVRVPYAIVPGRTGPAIRDPGHPWRAVAPQGAEVSVNGLRAVVRKVSFFTGRVELVITFENRGDGAVTVLPYGRSVLRDAKGAVFHPIATRYDSLTDRTLYTGLRLPASGRYTGFLTFATPDRFVPASLRLSLAPALADGADAPFSLDFPAFSLPG